MELPEIFNKTFKFDVGKLQIEPSYWQAAAIVFLVFLLILTLARLRHMYVGWSLKSFLPSIVFGFILAIIVEGFLIVGGKTLFIDIMGWENAPKPISTLLDIGRTKLVKVLGEKSENEQEEEDFFSSDEVIKA